MQPRTTMRSSLILLSSLALAASVSANLKFDFVNDPAHPANPQMVGAFGQAAAMWGNLISNDVTIRVKLGQAPNGVNPANGLPYIGASSNQIGFHSYADFRSALASGASNSATDVAALAHLETGPTFSARVNDVVVEKDANGNTVFDSGGRAVPVLDAQGHYQYEPGHTFTDDALFMTSANEKALGFTPTYSGDFADGFDANIIFADFSDLAPGSHLDWDYDPSDGIGTPGHKAYDAVGTMMHEIGHTLGFASEVDDRDYSLGYTDAEWSGYTTSLDLFRYESIGGTLQRSFQIGDRAEYFSLDGVTQGPRFSTGVYEGNGYQASHWYEDNPDTLDPHGYGLMKPATYKDRFNAVTPGDLAAFDAIGWNLTPQAVPEPAALLPLALGALALFRRRRK